jgi:mRNA interferase YafQ
MRTIDAHGKFRRDLKRELKGRYRQVIATELDQLIALLAADTPIPAHHRDHALTGDWKDHRDCHVNPDLVLIYRKLDAETLQLVRLGSHSELGL